MSVQSKQTGRVARKDFVGDLSEPAGIVVGGDHVEDFRADLRVAAEADGVLAGVEHGSVVIPVLYLDVNVGLSAQASLQGETEGWGVRRRPSS